MAVTIVQRGGNQTDSATSLSTTMSAYTAGSLLFVIAFCNGATLAGPSGWTAGPYATSGALDMGLWWRVSSGASTTVTVTPSGGPNITMEVYELTGLTNAIDKAASNGSAGAGTSLPTGTTAALASPSQLCIAAFAVTQNTEFVSAYTNGYVKLDGRGNDICYLDIASVTASSTAAQSCTATVTSSSSPVALIATFPITSPLVLKSTLKLQAVNRSYTY